MMAVIEFKYDFNEFSEKSLSNCFINKNTSFFF